MSTPAKMSLRFAQASDADDIARLTAQLGYRAEPSAVSERLSRILERPQERVLVAEVAGRVVGWLHAAVSEYLEADPFVVVGGLVVDSAHRKQGIGRALMDRVEQWAREQGCAVVRLSSSTPRTDAHRFYEQLGYTNIKTQYGFAKCVDPAKPVELSTFVPRVSR